MILDLEYALKRRKLGSLRFTQSALDVLARAWRIASDRRDNVRCTHILYALAIVPDGDAGRDRTFPLPSDAAERVRAAIQKELDLVFSVIAELNRARAWRGGEITLPAQHALAEAIRSARKEDAGAAGTRHLLEGLKSLDEGESARVLRQVGLL